MFTKLRVKNFKAWGDQLWKDGIELAPITLILGANSAGKTSLLQPLLLLKQTFQSPDRSIDLYLGGKKGDLLDLGTYEQIVHDHHTSAELGISVDLGEVTRSFAPVYPGDDLRGHWPQRDTAVGAFKYAATYGYAADSLHLKHLKFEHEGLSVTVARSPRGAYRLKAPGYAPRGNVDGDAAPKKEFKPNKSVILSDPARQAIGAYRLGTDDLSLAMSQAVEAIQYLGPLRERPQQNYLWGGQAPGEIGSGGEYAIPALLANLNAVKKSERGAIVDEVSRWLNQMGLADSLTLKQVGKSRFYEVVVRTAGEGCELGSRWVRSVPSSAHDRPRPHRAGGEHDHRRAAGDPPSPSGSDRTGEPACRDCEEAASTVPDRDPLRALVPAPAVPDRGREAKPRGV